MLLRDGNKLRNPYLDRKYSAGNLFAFTDPWALITVTKTLSSVTNLTYLPFISIPSRREDKLSTLSLENPLAGKVLNFVYRTFGSAR